MTLEGGPPSGAPIRRRKDWSVGSSWVNLHGRPIGRPQFSVTIPALPQILTFDLARAALIIVDMQNDFCTVGGWLDAQDVDVSAAAAAIDPLNLLAGSLRAHDVPIIWVNWGNRPDQLNLPAGVRHVYDPVGSSRGVGSSVGRSEAVLTEGSWGAQIVEGLDVHECDTRVNKFRMSGFFETPLDSILRQLDVDTILFGGVNLDQCVYTTLIDAANLGYNVVLVEGASTTTSPPSCVEATLYNVRQCFGFTSDFTAVVEAIGSSHVTQPPSCSPSNRQDHT